MARSQPSSHNASCCARADSPGQHLRAHGIRRWITAGTVACVRVDIDAAGEVVRQTNLAHSLVAEEVRQIGTIVDTRDHDPTSGFVQRTDGVADPGAPVGHEVLIDDEKDVFG